MPYRGSPSDFEAHPAGQHKGIVYLWKDRGMVQTPFGLKHKAMLGIESLTSFSDEDQRPHVVMESMNIAFGNNSTLKKRREDILGRELSKEERYDFDPSELMRARVGYVVKHRERDDGDGVWANLDSLWRLKDQQEGALQNDVVLVEHPEFQEQGKKQDRQQGASQGEADPAGLGGGTPYGEQSFNRIHAFNLLSAASEGDMITAAQAESTVTALNAMVEPDLEKFIERWEGALIRRGKDVPLRPSTSQTSQTKLDDDLPF